MPQKQGQNHLTRELRRVALVFSTKVPYSLPPTLIHPTCYICKMDRRTPYTLSVLAPSTNGADESRQTIQNRLRDFVLEFQLDNAFIYRYASHI
jgi:hypothetical protein